MSSTVKIGTQAEQFVCEYLESHGHEILGRNYYSRFGEIDIICKIQGWVVFVEVKSCTLGTSFSILETISGYKLERLNKTIHSWLMINSRPSQRWRLDFVGLVKHKGIYCIHHIPNI